MRSQKESRYNRVSEDGYDRVATLLPLRRTGPPTDVGDAIEALWSYQRPQSLFVPNLPSMVEQIRPSIYEVPVSREPKPLPERRVSYGHNIATGTPSAQPRGKRSGVTPHRTAASGPVARSPQRRRPAGEEAAQRKPSPRARRSRGIRQENKGEVTLAERVHFRNEVSRKLLDLYEEAVELDDCSENMVAQLTDAMRADPRRAREVFGFVRLTPRPTDEQQAALDDVTSALATLREALVELVAVYLTPDEKRHLGVDTNLFQSRVERETTYQYAPTSRGATTEPKTGGQPQRPRMVDDSTMTTGSLRADAKEGPHDDGTPTPLRQRTATPDPLVDSRHHDAAANETDVRGSADAEKALSPSLPMWTSPTPAQEVTMSASPSPVKAAPAAPFLSEAANPPFHATSAHSTHPTTPLPSVRHVDPQPVATPPGEDTGAGEEEAEKEPEGEEATAASEGNPVEETVAAPHATAATPPVTRPAFLKFTIPDSDADTEEAAVGTPERQQGPASNRSVSTLGGGPSSGPSPVRPSPPPAAVPPPLVTPPTTGPKGAPVKLLVKKMPISMAGVKKMPFPMPMRMPAPGRPPQEASGRLPAPPHNVSLKSASPAPSMPASAVRKLPAPAAPTTRAEFRRFMIDTDSESLA